METSLIATPWWGTFPYRENESRSFAIGPLRFMIRRQTREWLIFRDTFEAAAEEKIAARHITGPGAEHLELAVALADRPVVSRPVVPLAIHPGQEVTVYVSSPVWVMIGVGDPPRPLQEIPTQNLSDTWFGPSTMEGQLCYASTTSCRVRLSELPPRPHRVITPILVRNEAETPLLLDRIKLPVPLLSIYARADASLWTQSVVMTRNREENIAALKIADGPPAELGDTHHLGGPREKMASRTLIDQLGALFGAPDNTRM